MPKLRRFPTVFEINTWVWLSDLSEKSGSANEIVQHHDWLPTFLANLLPYLLYFDDDGNLVALRFDNWKVVFTEQRAPGTLRLWAEPFVTLRLPKLYNLRTDPFERADITSNTYYDWFLDHDYIVLAANTVVASFLETFKDFPPRQKRLRSPLTRRLRRWRRSPAEPTTENVSSLWGGEDSMPSNYLFK